MSKRIAFLAAFALLAGALAAPGTAFAQHHSRHGSPHPSHRYYGGHWGGGPYVYFGFGAPSYYYGGPYYYVDPYYYAPPPPPDCDWEQVRVWSRGRWVWRDVQRCY